jgi:hypothetical protein
LFSGYSTIPRAPASESFGHSSVTVRSSTTVLIATQFGSARFEMVGVASAGRIATTRSRQRRGTFIIRPTRSMAWIAPWSISSNRSILRFFQGSAQPARLAMNRGVLSSTVSITRRWFARRLEPVSVTSTIASARIGGFTSVAPHENSISALTPWRRR